MKHRNITAILFLISCLVGCSLSPTTYIIITATPRTTLTATPEPTHTATPTLTPTPTLDLSTCTVHGCASGSSERAASAMAEPSGVLVWLQEPPRRRICDECPENPRLSPAELASLTNVDLATLSLLHTIVTSSQAYEVAPGIVYIVDHNTHHVVIDLEEPGYKLRNIIPDRDRDTLITPSFCMSQDTLVITDADYYGLNGSNKTETGREVFFHPGWSALFRFNNRLDINVLDEKTYGLVDISWGAGPIFIWDGAYRFNPKYEWFTPENLNYYETSTRPATSASLSRDRKYLILTVSSGLTLKQHAEQVISLGKRWGIEIEKAIRFDGNSSTYLAIRLGDKLVPILWANEPKIANCFAVEKAR